MGHRDWSIAEKRNPPDQPGRWVTINGAHVFIPDAPGGKADKNHTPTNVVAKPPTHAPGHENPAPTRSPTREPRPGVPSTAHHFGTKTGKPTLRDTILNAKALNMTVAEYRRFRQGSI